MKTQKYWLMKSEPNDYSIADLEAEDIACWDGVRNYQARNTMRDEMQVGDLALFYHSNANPPGVAGVMRICRKAYPDHTAFDKKNPHYDPKAKEEDPTWVMVDVEFVEKFSHFVTLPELREHDRMEGLVLLKRGMRLSIQPVDREHFILIRHLGQTSWT